MTIFRPEPCKRLHAGLQITLMSEICRHDCILHLFQLIKAVTLYYSLLNIDGIRMPAEMLVHVCINRLIIMLFQRKEAPGRLDVAIQSLHYVKTLI